LLLDVGQPEGKELAETFNVRAFPTYLVLNADGEALYSWIGYGQPDGWIETLSGALADPITVKAREARYLAEANFQDAITLGKIYHRDGRYQEAESCFRQAQILDTRAATEADVPILIFRSIFYGVGSGDFTVEQAAANIEELFGSQNMKPEYALEVTERLASVKDQVGEEAIIHYLKMAYPLVSNIDQLKLEDRRQRFFVTYALIVEKDPEKALSLKRESLPEDWESDPSVLNGFAWWCFENKINLEEAEELAQKAVSISEFGPEQANYLDTLAELVNLRGDAEGAVELIKKALEMNPESQYLKDQLVKFQETLAVTG
jgi:tetratricopeptide (TPR) repeat protein